MKQNFQIFVRVRRASLLASSGCAGVALALLPAAAHGQDAAVAATGAVPATSAPQFAAPQTENPRPLGDQATPQEPPEASNTQGDIIVTASRRAESVTKLPFNISAYNADQLGKSNISSVTGLTQQVPNFVIEDHGARAAASSIPIIRGLNASQPSVTSARFFQNPVGFYLGNAPVTGNFPIYDIQRVEVLRGPQGTLYGAGSLSGAVRIVPVDPSLDKISGYVTASGATLSHSAQLGYSFEGALNLPLTSTLALRVGGRYQYEPGFIDQYDILKRVNDDYAGGAPVLANPEDVANSPGVYFNKKDSNYARTTAVRAALKWQPSRDLSLTAAYNLSYVEGNGGPNDNPTFKGGASPLDPRITLAARDNYERSGVSLEPFNRRSEMATLDASYDMGFATVSSTFTYGTTRGYVVSDTTQNLLGSPYGYYYTGIPANPRAVIPVTNPDTDRSYTEELRIVSNKGKTFDYILGAFFQQQKRYIGLAVWDPGADVQSAAANGGSTLPIAAGGTYIPLLQNGMAYYQDDYQRFNDYSVYGELTGHVTDRWQITGGVRAFHQTFSQTQRALSTFFFFTTDETVTNSVSSQIFKINTSYKINDQNQLYATWSQGFRRGGANSFNTLGPVAEPVALIPYVSDKTNNFEVGAKGTLGKIFYSFDLFYIDWNNPQIDLLTPYNLTAVVVNGKRASSKGAEFEMSGPILFDGLSFNVGMAYARARLTEDFSLPAGDGAGGVVPDAIHGAKGDRLPGAPDFSGSATINYKSEYAGVGKVTYSFGADFRSGTVNQLPSLSTNTPARYAPGFALFRANISLEKRDWTFQIYSTNLFDKRAVLAVNARSLSSYAILGNYGNSYTITRPREIGIKLTRNF